MITVTYLGESYECSKALKGADYIHLLDSEGCMVAAFDGITDFSGFTIDGDWTTPTPENDCYLAVMGDDGVIRKGGHKCCDIGNILPGIETIDTFWDDTYQLEVTDHGILWKDIFGLLDDRGEVLSSGEICQKVPIVEGNGIDLEIDEQDQVVRISATGGISDVQVNGSSVVTDGVANIPEASASQAGVVTTGAQTYAGRKSFNNGVSIPQGQSFMIGNGGIYATTSGYIYLGNSATQFSIGNPNSLPYATFTQSGLIKFAYQGTTTPNPKIQVHRPYYSKIYDAKIPYDRSGELMLAPSTWSTGTSGSAKLPESGLYEIKFTLGIVTHHFVVYWSENSEALSQISPLSAYGLSDGAFIWVEVDGYINAYSAQNGDASEPVASDTIISYRKIGIA